MATLDQYLQTNFSEAGTANTYQISQGTASAVYNCFAYAVGVTDKKITPSTRAALVQAYNAQGYFQVTSAVQAGDVEVYERTTEPGLLLHAHRVDQQWGQSWWCSSKIGNDCVIGHSRTLLQSAKPNSNQHIFGVVTMRFRYDAAKLKEFKLDQYVVTKSGRQVKLRDCVKTKSGRLTSKKANPAGVQKKTASSRTPVKQSGSRSKR
ncbi:MAG: hypothetical protein M1839_007757 [Geoglossum umbratile]|nr:MAG: hypothetical protein M1839_007757 [Geoglossum umbratile]